jgi:hypothetical protein
MEDFNAQINDQLGENFQRLNEGVENLIVWQDQYKQQILDSTLALQESSKAVGVTVQSLGEVTVRAQEFDKTATELKIALETMGASMTGIKSLAETLQDSGKEIRKEMEEITKKNLEALGQNLAGISEKLVKDYSELQRSFHEMVNGRN